jgi:predicted Zn-dependent protease
VDFDTDKTFYTETMARLLFQQGRYNRAAEVYRYLLAETPHRKDLEQALNNALSAIPKATVRWERIQGLIECWVAQMLRYKVLRQLQNLSIRKVEEKRAGE